jgi:hypothetical protein
VNRFIGPLALAACLALTSCADEPGDETAQAACDAYGQADTSIAQERAQRAAEANQTYAVLQRDMDDALSRAQALAEAQGAGRPVTSTDMDAYFAADEQVRADCAEAGNDIGPLRP